MDTVVGVVNSVAYVSGDFFIFSMELESGKLCGCKGNLLGIKGLSPGVPLELTGKWVNHPKYGRQLEVHSWDVHPSFESGVDKFLTCCLGLDYSLVGLLISAFGVNVIHVIKDTPEKLSTLDGVEEAQVDSVLEAWGLVQAARDLAGFFSDHAVTSSQVRAIFSLFGADSKAIITENPYRLFEVEGFTFNQVDSIASNLKISRQDVRRAEGAVLWLLRESALSGHLCLKVDSLVANLKDLLKQHPEVDSFKEFGLGSDLLLAVQRLDQRGAVKLDEEVGVYLSAHYKHERDSAHHLAKFLTPVKLEVDTDEFLNSYEVTHQIKLSEAQRVAVEQLTKHRVLVLTGLPGTGKTTVIKAIVSLFERAAIQFTLMAPTGIAAKRLSSVTGQPAATIHRTLRYDGDSWGYDHLNKYPIGAVIVDELSMVSMELFYRVITSLDESTILVLVGDDAQLPSVGPGNVLRELANCSVLPTVRLTQIFRQAEQSSIVVNSHRINRGESILAGGVDSDLRFVPIAEESQIADLVVQMAIKLKHRDANFQVLTPKYDGVVGVNALNDLLREALNPESSYKKEWSSGSLKFREGDRLMVIKNDYKLGVYNGDMGKLMSVRTDHFLVRIHGIGEGGLDVYVEFPKKDVLQKLRLAYAITVHKSQGSEFDTVILPIVSSQGRMLQRNLFYTAVTRAKRKVWLLGGSDAVRRSIANDQVIQRNTGLAMAVEKSFSQLAGN